MRWPKPVLLGLALSVVLASAMAKGKGEPVIPAAFTSEQCRPGEATPVGDPTWPSGPQVVLGCLETQLGTDVLLTFRSRERMCHSAAPAGGSDEASFCLNAIPPTRVGGFSRLTHLNGGGLLVTGSVTGRAGQARVEYTTVDGTTRSVRARVIRAAPVLSSPLGVRPGHRYFVAELPPTTVPCEGITIGFDGNVKSRALTKANASGVALPGNRPCAFADLGRLFAPFSSFLSRIRTAAAASFLHFSPGEGPDGRKIGVALAGRSSEGRPIRILRHGEVDAPAVLVFGCVHGDECAARPVRPLTGCPLIGSRVVTVPNLNPDGFALGTRLNGRGVDLNRNFRSDWKPIGRRWGPQYSGPRPFSEPETRLAARIIREVQPEVTIWFHQHHEPRPLVRAWGGSIPAARSYARLAHLPFRRLPWLAGTAPNWQNHRFPGTSSFVVEFPRGPVEGRVLDRLGYAIAQLSREVGED
jgi:protein MpaA